MVYVNRLMDRIPNFDGKKCFSLVLIIPMKCDICTSLLGDRLHHPRSLFYINAH